MIQFISEPNLIIYLKANTDTLMSRIKSRKRSYEADISSEYIHSLNIYYNKWINKINSTNVLVINTDNFNIFTDHKKYNEIVNTIHKRINGT